MTHRRHTVAASAEAAAADLEVADLAEDSVADLVVEGWAEADSVARALVIAALAAADWVAAV